MEIVKHFYQGRKKYLRLLKHDIEAWNKLRKTHSEITIDFEDSDLSYCNLKGANLSKINFKNANFYRSELENVNLSETDLSFADLIETSLMGANLSKSILIGADLSRANLLNSNLSFAKLNDSSAIGTNFINTNLTGVDFHSIFLFETIFADANLSKAKNLASCFHVGPSVVDRRTLSKSKNIPLEFLRGCGFNEWQIEVVKLNEINLTSVQISNIISEIARLRSAHPTNLASCFISYSTKDEKFAMQLHSDLESQGVKCWFAPKSLKIGDKIRDSIDKAIQLHDKLIIILSKESIDSMWVEDEVNAAIEKENYYKKAIIFPIRLDNAVLKTQKSWAARIRRDRYIGDFSHWKNQYSYKESIKKLLNDLKI